MRRGYICVLAFWGTIVGATAAQAQCSTFHTLTNGSAADAGQVMDNFNYILNCGNFSNIGINKSPAYVLDVNSVGYSNGTMAQFDNQYAPGGGIRLAYFGTTQLWLGEGSFISPALSTSDIGMMARGALMFDTGAGHSRPPLYISANGNSSFGYTSPQALLDMAGNVAGSSGATADAIRFTDLSGNGNSRNWLVGNGADGNFGDFAFVVSSTVGGAPGGTPVLTLAGSGNVGIGTASPGTLLSVYYPGGASAGQEVATFESSRSGPTDGTYIGLLDNTGGTHDTGVAIASVGNSLLLYAGGAERIRVAQNGNVGIGTATPSASFEVNGQTKLDALASASSTPLCINATNVVSSCSSSLRYKENIHDATFGLKEIEAMRPVTFKWKGRNESDFGLVAEEVAKINPLFVTKMNGKIEGVKYPQLVAVLVNAIKELEADNRKQHAELVLLREARTTDRRNQASELRKIEVELRDLRQATLHRVAEK